MATKRKMPKKLAELDLGSEGYDGFYVQTWINAPVAFMRRLDAVRERVMAVLLTNAQKKPDDPTAESTEDDEDEAGALLLELFPSWRGFVDYKGDKIPHSAAGLDSIPLDLTEAMWVKRRDALRNGALAPPLGTDSSGAPSDGSKG